MVQLAVTGRTGEWVRGGVNGTVCHCGGAPLGEWGRDLASSGMSSVTVFRCGLSCLCPRESHLTAVGFLLAMCVKHLGQAVPLGVQVCRNSSFRAPVCV